MSVANAVAVAALLVAAGIFILIVIGAMPIHSSKKCRYHARSVPMANQTGSYTGKTLRMIVGFCVVGLAGALAWKVGKALDPAALNMALGMIFGVLAGIPAALLVLTAGRGRQPPASDPWAVDAWATASQTVTPNPGTALARMHPSQPGVGNVSIAHWQAGYEYGLSERAAEDAIDEWLEGYTLATGKSPNQYMCEEVRRMLDSGHLTP